MFNAIGWVVVIVFWGYFLYLFLGVIYEGFRYRDPDALIRSIAWSLFLVFLVVGMFALTD